MGGVIGSLGVAVLLVPLAALRAAGGGRRQRWVVRALAAVALLGLGHESLGLDLVPWDVGLISALALFAYVAVFVLVGVVRAGRVTGDTLCGAAAVYLLLGLTWMLMYEVVERVAPGSFLGLAGEEVALHGGLLYFSFVTLATLGYGDIAPVTAAGRMVAILEVITGTFYLAVLVARLVSMYVVASSGGRPGGQSHDG